MAPARHFAALLLGLPFAVASCKSPPAEPGAAISGCKNGYLATELVGARKASLDWQGNSMTCEGMPRPDGEGARLRFAGPAQSGSARQSLVFILAMPELERGSTGRELPTNVTFTEEGSGRFFGTGTTDNCLTDVHVHEAEEHVNGLNYRISGVVYCLGPMAELNGTANISFAELHFSGRLDWRVPE